MKRKLILAVCLLISSLLVGCGMSYARQIKPIKLLPARVEGGKPLMQALKERKSMREFSSQELPLQVISDMLWAAFGINRPDSGGRTAPSGCNMQEIDIYVAKPDGVYLYDAKANMLMPVVAKDLRSLTGKDQPFVEIAPINLIFVADLTKMRKELYLGRKLKPGEEDFFSATDTGFISQNVYLFCASSGLATVVRGWLDKPALAKAMKLKPTQKIVLAQTVGYPK